MQPRGILVVDDEPSIIAIVGQMLKEHFTGPIFFASSAAKAAELWNEPTSQIDVLITDIALGQSSGEELAANFVRFNPAGKVVIITGYEVDEDELRRTVGKPLAILRKPFSAQDLHTALL